MQSARVRRGARRPCRALRATDNPLVAALAHTPMGSSTWTTRGSCSPTGSSPVPGSPASAAPMRSRSSSTGARSPRQPDGRLHVVPAGTRARGRGRGRRPRARGRGLEVGDRVVLNPWLSCAPGGVAGVPGLRGRRPEPVLELPRAPIAPGSTPARRSDATGGWATLMPAHDSMLFPVPTVTDELAVFADPFAVSLHSVTRHPPPPGGGARVRRGSARHVRGRDPARPVSRRRGRGRRAVRRASGPRPRARRARVLAHEPATALIEEAPTWSAACSRRSRAADGVPGGIDVVYDTVWREGDHSRCQ